MTFTQSISTCFRKYAVFRGRASQSEYWWFVLFCLLGSLAAEAVEAVINGATGSPDGPTLLSAVFGLATFLPQLAAGWRRMHDTGRSGLYLLYPLIVMIGILSFAGMLGALPGGAGFPEGAGGLILIAASVVFLISPLLVLWWLTRPSQPGTNEYGPNPHGEAA